MKHNSFPSKEELLLQSNTIKRRQERIIQAREQSKQMSAAILEKAKGEARKKCEEIENQVLSEIRNYHQKELEYSRKQYEKCISEINQRHYLQQVNVNSTSPRISNNKQIRHLCPMKSATSINNNRKVEKSLEEKSTVEPLEQLITSAARKPNEKLNGKKMRPVSRLKQFLNIVIDSDNDEVEKHTILNFRKHSPEVKHLKSLQSENENGNRSKCRGKAHCPRDHKLKLMNPKTNDDHVIPNDKFNKTQIDEMYNHLVHDRIRILEQKNKILDRRTMFLQNGAVMANKPPRFSEYFARFQSTKIPPTKTIATIQTNTSHNDSGMNEILEDMQRIEMKKKSLRNELTKSNDAIHSKTVSLLEEKQKEKKQDSLPNNENPTSNSNSEKNSPASNSSDSSSKKTQPQSVICPSPISKVTHDINDNSPESDQKEKSLLKRRQCKRKLRSKEIQVTVSNSRKSVTVCSSDTVVNTQQNNISSSSLTPKDFHQNTAAPVKLVVNVLPSTDCTIEIKSNAADKRYLNCSAKRNAEKVKDWRTLFKNQEKLTESSYFSPPDYDRKIQASSSEEYNEQVSPDVDANNIGYYVRKLLMMSPESVDDLDVSSCDTTLVKGSSRNVSNDLNPINKQVSSIQKLPKCDQFIDTKSGVDNSENARKLLLECLKLATVEANDINLTTFKSVDSSCDKVLGNSSTAMELNDSNISCKNFINTAIQRLLPLYQNSLDDNLDCTTQSQRILNYVEDQSEAEESKDDSALISSSAYLQKFVSSLSGTSEKPGKNYDVIEYLKQYIELQSPSDKSNEISPDSFDHADNVVFKDVSCISLPSADKISKTSAVNETQDEPKEFLDEEEFIKRMLQTDFIAKETYLENDSGQSENKNHSDNHQSELDEKYITDIRKDLRRLGLNWMDTTLQRTLQASVINSTSSTEDSAGPLRNNSKFFSHYRPSISSSLNAASQQSKLPPRELLNISPIKIPDLQLNVPQCFQKN